LGLVLVPGLALVLVPVLELGLALVLVPGLELGLALVLVPGLELGLVLVLVLVSSHPHHLRMLLKQLLQKK
jgi:hypothetical protein